MSAALQSLRERGAEAFVLDLRDNRGGLVNQGVEVAKLFLDSALRCPPWSQDCVMCGEKQQ